MEDRAPKVDESVRAIERDIEALKQKLNQYVLTMLALPSAKSSITTFQVL